MMRPSAPLYCISKVMVVAVEDLVLRRVTGTGLVWKNIPKLERLSLKSTFETINIVNNVKYYIAWIKTWPDFFFCIFVRVWAKFNIMTNSLLL